MGDDIGTAAHSMDSPSEAGGKCKCKCEWQAPGVSNGRISRRYTQGKCQAPTRMTRCGRRPAAEMRGHMSQ